MIRLLILYSIVLCFLNIDLTRSTSSNDYQSCNVSCSTQDETCKSKIEYHYCLKTKTGGTDIDCGQELNETEEYICENCDWSNSEGLKPDELDAVLECSQPFLNHGLGMATPKENCGYILDYLECRSETEVNIECKNTQGIGSPPSYKDLNRMAFSLCSGANGSLYTTCDRFLEEYKKIFVVEEVEFVMKLSDGRWWCHSFMKVLEAAGIVTQGSDCEILDYDSLSRNLSLKYQGNWTEYCYIPQESSPSTTAASSPTHTSSTYTPSTFRSTALPSTNLTNSTTSDHTEITTPKKMKERNDGKPSTSSGYVCLLAYVLVAVISK
ncbi:hypothetical protein LOTGIDRAFT_228174 [Lottia gigantea]|uniref:SRCR domain-containing protein n=1 Tax=Lottia gigantea TaxID=225164 RepID=V4ANF8_LOTGI|nr:hypothetical protein LOTGIDRAFT_228174 [Lottia gigantea]ESP05709.1 hypothetical protein LOTGIDRAFT_228174 [Lottia gigantea]